MATTYTNYKYCVVPMCTNSTVSAPGKVFITMPKVESVRKKWCSVMKRDAVSSKSCRHVCEDHFDLEKDIENYLQYKLQGVKIRLRKDAVPHKFECQRPVQPTSTSGIKRRKASMSKRPKLSLHLPVLSTDNPHKRVKKQIAAIERQAHYEEINSKKPNNTLQKKSVDDDDTVKMEELPIKDDEHKGYTGSNSPILKMESSCKSKDTSLPIITSIESLFTNSLHESHPDFIQCHSNSSEQINCVTHAEAFSAAETLLHYMMNQDDVNNADINFILNLAKKIKRTHNAVQDKLRMEEVSSDLESTDPEDKRLNKRKIYLSSSPSSSDDEIPDPAQLMESLGKKGTNSKENRNPLIEQVEINNIDNLHDSFTSSMINDTPDIIGSSESCSINEIIGQSLNDSKTSCQNTGYLKAILKSVLSMKMQMTNMENKLEEILSKVSERSCSKVSNSNNLPTNLLNLLPLGSKESLDEFEEKLSNPIVTNQMVSYFQKLGGDSYNQAVKFIMRKLFTNEFAVSFSYLGRKGKSTFKDTQVCKLIFDAVLTNNSYSNVTEYKIIKEISEWLRHAKARSH